MRRLRTAGAVRERERERERESYNLKTKEQKIKTAQKPNNQNTSPNNKLFDENYDAIKKLTSNNTCRGRRPRRPNYAQS